MSNAVMNAHIMMGEPCGDGVGIMEVADWAGDLIISGNKTMKDLTALVHKLADQTDNGKLTLSPGHLGGLIIGVEWYAGDSYIVYEQEIHRSSIESDYNCGILVDNIRNLLAYAQDYTHFRRDNHE